MYNVCPCDCTQQIHVCVDSLKPYLQRHKMMTPDLKPIWLMWSVSSSIFHSRQRNSGGEPCMEKWVMMSFSLAMDFHFLYSSSTFFFRLNRDS